MEPEKIPLNEIRIDPLAQELVRSEQARPYTDYFMKAFSNDAAGSRVHFKCCGICRLKVGVRGGCFLPSSGHSRISMTNV
jgi:hypothetical protein